MTDDGNGPALAGNGPNAIDLVTGKSNYRYPTFNRDGAVLVSGKAVVNAVKAGVEAQTGKKYAHTETIKLSPDKYTQNVRSGMPAGSIVMLVIPAE